MIIKLPLLYLFLQLHIIEVSSLTVVKNSSSPFRRWLEKTATLAATYLMMHKSNRETSEKSSETSRYCSPSTAIEQASNYNKCNRNPPVLPEKLIVGYANWNQCDDQIIDAVKSGVNVVIWFAINLVSDDTTRLPGVKGGPDFDCVAQKIKAIRELALPCVHLISVGGLVLGSLSGLELELELERMLKVFNIKRI
jgi:hypothetical protein